VSGVQIDLVAERITLDYDEGRAGAFIGTAAPVLAVAAVAHLYGAEGLLLHPAIRVLHASPSPTANIGRQQADLVPGERV
jgi:hypothetical protein